MKITILSNRDLASCVALNHLLPGLVDHEVNVFLSSRVGGSTEQAKELQDLKFYEQDLFLNTVFPIADALDLTEPQLRSFDSLARKFDLEITILNKINGEEAQRFQSSEPDLVLSIRYGMILKEAAIALPKYGVLNLHSGKLPDYKGVIASFRAMLNGDKELASTLHYIDDSSIDTGKVIGISCLPMDSSKSYLWHVLALYEDGCRLMLENVLKIGGGEEIKCLPQEASGNYFSFPEQQDLERFREKGLRLFDSNELVEIAKRFYRSD